MNIAIDNSGNSAATENFAAPPRWPVDAIRTCLVITYLMIKPTLRFDDVEDILGLLPLLRAVQRSHMRSRKRSGRRPGNEARLHPPYP